jgi:hypothetical protein
MACCDQLIDAIEEIVTGYDGDTYVAAAPGIIDD